VAGLSACSSPPRASPYRAAPTPSPQPASPVPTPRTAAQLIQQLRRSTAIACSPYRNAFARRLGGPFCLPWDSIPAVGRPDLVTAPAAGFLAPSDPVVSVDVGGESHAYPIGGLDAHEIVNDVVGGEPVVVTYCPLCNSAVAFSRRVGERVLTFGVTGRLDYANLIMFDRQTVTEWQQLTGVGSVGPLAGERLRFIPAQMSTFAVWRASHPGGLVMREAAGAGIDYGIDPYHGYDRGPDLPSPFLVSPGGEGPRTDPRLPPKWRVVGAITPWGAVAFALPRHPGGAVVETARVGGIPLVGLFRYGMSEPGVAYHFRDAPRGWFGAVFEARLGRRRLAFRPQGTGLVEISSGSRFDVFGLGHSGPYAGRQLEPVPQATAFWFAWSNFFPTTQLTGSDRPALDDRSRR
jgi:Protein of unknown function (DUF3179)